MPFEDKTFEEIYAICKAEETGAIKPPWFDITPPWTEIKSPCSDITPPWTDIKPPWTPVKQSWASLTVSSQCPFASYIADDEGMDYRGNGWKIIRDGKERAVACPGDKYDTIETLADKIGLDKNESSKWLFDGKEHGITNEDFTYRKAYTIPNTVIVAAGTGQQDMSGNKIPAVDQTQAFIGIARYFSSKLQEDGFCVKSYYTYSGNDILNAISNPNTFGFVFIGHSEIDKRQQKDNILLPNNAYALEKNRDRYMEASYSETEEKRKFNASKVFEVTRKAEREYLLFAINASQIMKSRNYKFGYLILLACETNKNGQWENAVSPNGVYVLPTSSIPFRIDKTGEIVGFKTYYAPPRGRP